MTAYYWPCIALLILFALVLLACLRRMNALDRRDAIARGWAREITKLPLTIWRDGKPYDATPERRVSTRAVWP